MNLLSEGKSYSLTLNKPRIWPVFNKHFDLRAAEDVIRKLDVVESGFRKEWQRDNKQKNKQRRW
jgi:hypothetical protein